MEAYHPPYSINSDILRLVSSIVEKLSQIQYQEQSVNIPRLRKVSRIKTLAGTLAIEGNTLGEENVTAIIEGKRVLGSYSEISEVEGAVQAYEALPNYDYRQEASLLNAHQLMMQKLQSDAGNYRKINVAVGEHIAPPAQRVPELMHRLFGWLQNTTDHLLVVSCVFHYELEFIHPFSDGNGRMGRLWQSLILYHWKTLFAYVPIESIVHDHQEAYYDAIEASTECGESTPFVLFMLEMILGALESVPKYDPNNDPKDRLELIVEMMKRDNTVTTNQLAASLGVSQKTIKRDIQVLREHGKVERAGSSRSGVWVVQTF